MKHVASIRKARGRFRWEITRGGELIEWGEWKANLRDAVEAYEVFRHEVDGPRLEA